MLINLANIFLHGAPQGSFLHIFEEIDYYNTLVYVISAAMILIGILLIIAPSKAHRSKHYFKLVMLVTTITILVTSFLIFWRITPSQEKVLQSAHNLTHSGMYEDALDLLNKFIQEHPDNSLAFSYRGMLFAETENFENALSDFETALQIAKQSDNSSRGLINEALIYRGKTFLQMEKYDLANKDFSAVIETDPLRVEAFLLRADIFYNMKKFDEALCDYENYLAGTTFNNSKVNKIVQDLKNNYKCTKEAIK